MSELQLYYRRQTDKATYKAETADQKVSMWKVNVD